MAVVNLSLTMDGAHIPLLLIFLITVSITTVGFFAVVATSRIRRKQGFASKTKHHPETYWAIGVTAILVWLWIISYPWIPPVSFLSFASWQRAYSNGRRYCRPMVLAYE